MNITVRDKSNLGSRPAIRAGTAFGKKFLISFQVVYKNHGQLFVRFKVYFPHLKMSISNSLLISQDHVKDQKS